MSELIILSKSIARQTHAGQLYDERDYYDAHIIPVVKMITKMGYDEEYQAVGYLHDVIEDSNGIVTAKSLIERGIPKPVVSAVELLTKIGEKDEVYLGKIATNNRAIVAKFADSSVNYAVTMDRMRELEDDQFNRWINRYSRNISFLKPLLPPTSTKI